MRIYGYILSNKRRGFSPVHQLNTRPVFIALLKDYFIRAYSGEMQVMEFFIKNQPVSKMVFSDRIKQEPGF